MPFVRGTGRASRASFGTVNKMDEYSLRQPLLISTRRRPEPRRHHKTYRHSVVLYIQLDNDIYIVRTKTTPKMDTALKLKMKLRQFRVPVVKLEQSEGPQMLLLDIGGEVIELKVTDILSRAGSSRINRLMSNPKRWMSELRFWLLPRSTTTNCLSFFIERPPTEAKLVKQYYEQGYVTQPRSMCPFRLYHVLQFWGIPMNCVDDTDHINPVSNIFKRRDSEDLSDCSLDTLQLADFISETENLPCADVRIFVARVRRQIWLSIERHENRFGHAFSFISVMFIILSLTGLVMSSMRQFQVPKHYIFTEVDSSSSNVTLKTINITDWQPIIELRHLEHICIGWFTIEFILRLVASHEMGRFCAEPLNVVDLLTIVPFYINTALEMTGIDVTQLERLAGVMVVLRALRVLRVARLLRLIRYSKALRIIVHSFTSSFEELCMFTMLTTTAIVFFATVEYFVECDTNQSFRSIPASCWWCVVTMTIIGYGDAVPHTTAGKIVAGLASICGMIVLAFPVTMVVEKFVNRQQEVVRQIEEQEYNEHMKKKATPPKHGTEARLRQSMRHARFMRRL